MAGRSASSAVRDVSTDFDSPLRGILFITAGITVFGLQDVIIRTLSGQYAAMEIMLIRGLVALGPMALLVYWDGGFSSLRVKHPWLNLLRSLLGVCSYTAFYMSLASLPLAEVTAIFFVAPLSVTLFSALFLREAVGTRRWIAVIVGFAGVLVIVQPAGGGLEPAALLPLAAAITYACSMVMTRRIGRTQTGASLAFISMLVFVAASAVAGAIAGDGRFADESHPSLSFLLRAWVLPDEEGLLLIGICGFIAAFGFYCLSQGYRVAPASIVAPFEFVAMPLAIFWGIVFWGEYPPLSTLGGIALIIGGGLYALHREAARKRHLNSGRGVRLRL